MDEMGGAKLRTNLYVQTAVDVVILRRPCTLVLFAGIEYAFSAWIIDPKSVWPAKRATSNIRTDTTIHQS